MSGDEAGSYRDTLLQDGSTVTLAIMSFIADMNKEGIVPEVLYLSEYELRALNCYARDKDWMGFIEEGEFFMGALIKVHYE